MNKSNDLRTINDYLEPSFQIIQGGMGVGISSWNLANIVSRNKELGVISGTALDSVLVRRLQDGDLGGHMHRAMSKFPVSEIADKVYEKYFISGGKKADVPYIRQGMFRLDSNINLLQLTVLANFVEVYLAKEGHNNPVGINFLEKIQLPHLPSIYGAMLADVGYVLMGAGIPRQIPGVLDLFSKHEPASYHINVQGAKVSDKTTMHFNPKEIIGSFAYDLKRPEFLAIISSATLAHTLTKKASGKVNGFIVELPTAGGHNAPPRGNYPFNEKGEPIYGLRDEVDLEKMKELGLPFWMAGGYGLAGKLNEARSLGATGIQVGTLFFLSDESGLDKKIKQKVINKIISENLEVYTDPIASPTGFPFKVVQMKETNSEKNMYEKRQRVCDLGYLRTGYEKENGTIGYRCPSEPIETYLKKGGSIEATQGRKCLCNGLMANLNLGQVQKNGDVEQALLTAGDNLTYVNNILKNGKISYSAVDVLDYLRG